MAVLGSLVDLVARDDRRVMSISLRECGLGLDVPADRLVSKKGPPADGRLLFARFSIGDMLIRDTMARELHSVVSPPNQTHGKRCSPMQLA